MPDTEWVDTQYWSATRWCRAVLSRFATDHTPEDVAAMHSILATDGPQASPRWALAMCGMDAETVQHDLHTARKLGVRLLIPEDPHWPHPAFLPTHTHAGTAGTHAGADTTSDTAGAGCVYAAPPVALWVCGPGCLAAVSTGSVAVIGARAASHEGMVIAAQVSHDLTRAGVTVVSSASYGIDGAALQATPAAGGAPVAVLACGHAQPHPPHHRPGPAGQSNADSSSPWHRPPCSSKHHPAAPSCTRPGTPTTWAES